MSARGTGKRQTRSLHRCRGDSIRCRLQATILNLQCPFGPSEAASCRLLAVSWSLGAGVQRAVISSPSWAKAGMGELRDSYSSGVSITRSNGTMNFSTVAISAFIISFERFCSPNCLRRVRPNASHVCCPHQFLACGAIAALGGPPSSPGASPRQVVVIDLRPLTLTAYSY